MKHFSDSSNDHGWESDVELERMNHYENAGGEVPQEWEYPEEQDVVPNKELLTKGHSFDGTTQLAKYPPFPNALKPFSLIRAGNLGDPVETADFVQGLLTEGGASVIYGPSNTGKSFWVLELAASVATGKPFMDVMEVDQGAVIYFALEGIHGARNRIHALMCSDRLYGRSPLHLCFEPLSLLRESDVDRMIAAIKEANRSDGGPCKLVIIDTLARAMPGGDENQGKDMGKYVFGKDKIRNETGAHVMSVHHCGKNEDNGARGHSSLRAAMDTEIRITRPSEGLVSLVTVTKQRDLPISDPMAFSLESIDLGLDRRGNSITSCLVNPEAEIPHSQPKSPGRKAKYTPEDLLSLLPASSINDWQERAESKFGIKRSQFFDHKKTLEENQSFRKDPEKDLIVAC